MPKTLGALRDESREANLPAAIACIDKEMLVENILAIDARLEARLVGLELPACDKIEETVAILGEFLLVGVLEIDLALVGVAWADEETHLIAEART